MPPRNNIAVEEMPHSITSFLIKRSKLAKIISLGQGIRCSALTELQEESSKLNMVFRWHVVILSDDYLTLLPARVDGVCESSASPFYGLKLLQGGGSL